MQNNLSSKLKALSVRRLYQYYICGLIVLVVDQVDNIREYLWLFSRFTRYSRKSISWFEVTNLLPFCCKAPDIIFG